MRRMLVLALVAGCTGGTASDDFIIVGAISGATAPESGTAFVLWTVSTPSVSSYKFGEGNATKYQFLLELGDDPPPAAVHANGIAVGDIVLVAPGTVIPDGTYTGGATILGITMDHALIWKDPLKTGFGTWDATFGARYSCARCVRSATGLHGYELAPCSQVTIAIGGSATCQWF